MWRERCHPETLRKNHWDVIGFPKTNCASSKHGTYLRIRQDDWRLDWLNTLNASILRRTNKDFVKRTVQSRVRFEIATVLGNWDLCVCQIDVFHVICGGMHLKTEMLSPRYQFSAFLQRIGSTWTHWIKSTDLQIYRSSSTSSEANYNYVIYSFGEKTFVRCLRWNDLEVVWNALTRIFFLLLISWGIGFQILV